MLGDTRCHFGSAVYYHGFNMPGTIILPMVAAQNAANMAMLANIQAQQRTEHCQRIESSFNANAATTETKKEYADCINYLYPDPASHGEHLMVSGVIILALMGFIGGGIWGWKDDLGGDFLTIVIFALLGVIMLPFIVCLPIFLIVELVRNI